MNFWLLAFATGCLVSERSCWGKRRQDQEKGSISFLKKRNKKLLFVGIRTERAGRVNQQEKVFWLFSSEKNCLLASLIFGSGNDLRLVQPVRRKVTQDFHEPLVRQPARPVNQQRQRAGGFVFFVIVTHQFEQS
jgi:hypothetical protein